MSNSSLVSYTKISPNKTSPRNHKIDTITIHCVVGQCSVETLGNVFAPTSRQASSNYGIGKDGKVGMYVEEKDRSWCSSNAANDHRAITIECASDTSAPYAINDTVYKALIELCTDICKRNGISKLVWSTDKNTRVQHLNGCNMTVHRDYANKSCPGDYIYNRLGQIASEVNAKLGSSTVVTPTQSENSGTLYRVQTGAFSNKANADTMLAKVKAAGFDTYMVKVGNLYKIQVGAFSQKSNADTMAAKLKADGFDTYITTEQGQAVSFSTTADASKKIAVGSTVRVKQGAKTYTGGSLASFVYNRNHKVSELSGDRAVITYDGIVVAAVRLSDLTAV